MMALINFADQSAFKNRTSLTFDGERIDLHSLCRPINPVLAMLR